VKQHRSRALFPSVLAKVALLGGACAFGSFAVSCGLDPVHDGAVKALGDEDPNIPQGAYHRAGQPCNVCHDVQGPAENKFALSGTVFWGPNLQIGVDQAYVRVVDANRAQKCFVTNCVGNFFVRPEDFPKLTFPILVSVEKPPNYRAMAGRIGRERACGNCHKQPRFFDSPGQIRLVNSESEVPADGKAAFKQCNVTVDPPKMVCPEDQDQ